MQTYKLKRLWFFLKDHATEIFISIAGLFLCLALLYIVILAYRGSP